MAKFLGILVILVGLLFIAVSKRKEKECYMFQAGFYSVLGILCVLISPALLVLL